MLPRKPRSSHRRCSVKEALQGPAQMFSCECCEIFKSTDFEKICQRLLLKISPSVTDLPEGGNSRILLSFQTFYSILYFTMTERFCYVTCFTNLRRFFLVLFFPIKHLLIIKKLFYNTRLVRCYNFFILEIC